MTKKQRKFYDAWWFLYEHPMTQQNGDGLSRFDECLDVYVAKVNPLTGRKSHVSGFNTKLEIWLEFGGWHAMKRDNGGTRYIPEHDIRLDCGGSTYEEAIINLAKRVKKYYGDVEVDE